MKELEETKQTLHDVIEALRRESLAKGENIYVVQDTRKARLLKEYIEVYADIEKKIMEILKLASDIGVMASEDIEERERWLKRMREELEKELGGEKK